MIEREKLFELIEQYVRVIPEYYHVNPPEEITADTLLTDVGLDQSSLMLGLLVFLDERDIFVPGDRDYETERGIKIITLADLLNSIELTLEDNESEAMEECNA